MRTWYRLVNVECKKVTLSREVAFCIVLLIGRRVSGHPQFLALYQN